ncbi:MAG: recombinase zinc beta ribbon domain-containing protein, partial [Planctomycetes bacterium]|nr:recombinase zinc beta ribbon domain-containing protein [Planctomycetota bacterium]
KLQENRTQTTGSDPRGAAREGAALLQGLVLCGKCGERMHPRYRGRHRPSPFYLCDAPSRRLGVNRPCWSVSARAIDEAVVSLFLQTVQVPEIELALAVAREAERQAGDVDRQWKLQLERARYDAQLAERRYKAVDPDNRVVARTLESEWNEKLATLEELENEHQEVRRREKIDLSAEDRSRILSLARDLPLVWNAATTTQAQRKNLLRLLVREVTITPIDVPERQTHLKVLWQTGAVGEFVVERAHGPRPYVPPAEAVALIGTLFSQMKSDPEICAELNRRGLRTGANHPWGAGSVRKVRQQHGWRGSRVPPHRRPDGLFSVRGVAHCLGVSEAVVSYWTQTGRLEAVAGGGRGQTLWFRLDPPTVKGLKAAKGRGPRRHAHSRTQVQKGGHCE